MPNTGQISNSRLSGAEEKHMATITIVGKGSGVRVRAKTTGGHGHEDQTTDSSGDAHFKDTANRVQIQVWSTSGSRWVDTGDVIQPLRGNHQRRMPF